ncbi:MAG: hypothetical protein RL289_1005 [Actinomycetota bacterium]
MAGISSTAVLVSSCSISNDTSVIDTTASEIEDIVKAKRELISDATGLIASDPNLSAQLQIVIDQSLLHIESLTPYLPPGSSSSERATVPTAISLPAIVTRCAVFSTNNLNTASAISDAELSRILALIAGSEMQHHALLSGLVA